jgi:hypothetical protein
VSDAPGQIDYAPRPHALRGPRARRIAIILGAILLIGAMLWVGPRALRRWQVLRWQRQCLSYVAPPDQVVHETDPAEIPTLLAPPLNYRGSLAAGQAFYIPAAYGNLVVSQSVGTAFLHERASPDGGRRLVAVDLFSGGGGAGGAGGSISLLATVIEPAAGAIATITRGDGQTIARRPGDKLRVFAGQPDPNDASHFTIDYDLNGVRHTLDGWVVDDSEIKIESRD